jgi:hypothetical protein
MKHLYKLSLFIFLPFFTLAQSNYKPGYIVTTKGDTIRGFIDFRDWGSNPTTISFKSNQTSSKKKSFGLGEISSFNVTGLVTYKKFICSVSLDQVSTSNISTVRDTSFKVDTVFLKVLQQGTNAALYQYTDNIKERFYVGEAPGFTPVELIYRIYYDAASTAVNENTYQKQLFALSDKYKVLDDKQISLIQNSQYRQEDLLAIVSKINNVSKAEFEKNYVVHSKISFYGGAALNILQNSSSASSYSASGGVGYTSYLPSIKAGIDFLPDPNGRLEFRVDVSANFAKFDALYKLTVEPYGPMQLSFNQVSIALTPQVILNIYNAQDFKFYIGVGVAPGLYRFSNPYFGSQNKNQDDGLANEPYLFETSGFPFVLKAGFRVAKRLDIYFDYYTSTPTTNGGYFGLSNQSKQIGLNYYFVN